MNLNRYLSLFFSFFIILTKCEQPIQITAEFYPETNKILYNGEMFAPIPQLTLKPQSNSTQKQVLVASEMAVPFSTEFWIELITFSVLALFAGTVSGLTVGYLSIDDLILEIKMRDGTEDEKYYASKIYKLVSNHHLLLVTLLLCNSFACEAMPIVLHKLVSEIMAIVLSVTVLLFVGEIIPMSLCTGPNQMKIASFLAPFTSLLVYITYPLSYPIAKFMDCVIGVHGKTRFCNSDLKSIIKIHVKDIISNLTSNQVGYFTGFLDIMNKKIGELILPIEKVLKIDFNSKIDHETLTRLIDSGFSRIPVYENNIYNLIGILRMKKLVGKDITEPATLSQLGIGLSQPIHAYEDTLFLDLFEKFKDGKSHMAFIHKRENKEEISTCLTFPKDNNIDESDQIILKMPIIGIITLEDLIEFWLKIQIYDEEDYDEKENTKTNLKQQSMLLDKIGIDKIHNKINQLYDKSPNMIKAEEIKIDNNEYNNDYHAFKE